MPAPAPAARLSQLEVDEVSIVDRAAVRDAQDRTQPMKFALYKRERGSDGRFKKADDPVDAEIAEMVLKIEEHLAKLDEQDAPEI